MQISILWEKWTSSWRACSPILRCSELDCRRARCDRRPHVRLETVTKRKHAPGLLRVCYYVFTQNWNFKLREEIIRADEALKTQIYTYTHKAAEECMKVCELCFSNLEYSLESFLWLFLCAAYEIINKNNKNQLLFINFVFLYLFWMF